MKGNGSLLKWEERDRMALKFSRKVREGKGRMALKFSRKGQGREGKDGSKV